MKKPGKSLPDTNTIIRYLVRDDEPLYLKAKDFFDKVKTGRRQGRNYRKRDRRVYLCPFENIQGAKKRGGGELN